MKARFHHAGIVVPDLEKGIGFYRHLLGLEEQIRFEWNETQERVKDVIDLEGSAARAANGFSGMSAVLSQHVLILNTFLIPRPMPPGISK